MGFGSGLARGQRLVVRVEPREQRVGGLELVLTEYVRSVQLDRVRVRVRVRVRDRVRVRVRVRDRDREG